MYKRLVKSSLLDRLKKLEDAAIKLGISIKFSREVILVDTKTGKEYDFLDLEANPNHIYSASSYINEFPPQLEYKLCWEEDLA